MLLNNLQAAIQFFSRLNGRGAPDIVPDEQTWALKDKKVAVSLYWPNVKPKGAILMVHGMNSLGAHDPRVIKLCQVLASLGLVCVAPTVKTISQHLILTDQANDVRQVMYHMLADNRVCPNGQLGIFTASFSGAISIIAAADKQLRDRITALLTIGIYHDGVATMLDLLSNECEDHFARLIGLKNLFRLTKQVDPVIDQALEFAIQDVFSYIADGHVDAYLKTLSHDDKVRVQTMLSAIANRTYQPPEAIIQKFDPDAFRHGFDFLHLLPTLPFRIFALHSEDDKIMYAHHTQALRKFVKHSRLHHHILISPLLDHADADFSFKKAWAIIKAARFLSAYFKDIMSNRES